MGQFQSTRQIPPTRNNNNNIVPMDVDATLTSTIPGTPFQKLTDDEWKKLSAEGRCFRCHQQGHMACQCPRHLTPTPLKYLPTARTTDTNITDATSDISEPSSPTNTTTTSLPPRTLAQQIADLQAQMTEQELGDYLNAHDLGEGFCDADI